MAAAGSVGTATDAATGNFKGFSMASKRHVRRKACKGKQAHTREGAAKHAHSLWKGKGDKVSTYHCRWCGAWHVGHFVKRRPAA
jgi:hypothetical protein